MEVRGVVRLAAEDFLATNPEQLGEQLALLLNGASARNRLLNSDTFAAAAVLIDNATPTAAVPLGPGGNPT